jgi:cardiolipin synthase
LGLLIHLFFGRETKAFSKQNKQLRQDLAANALPILSRQDAGIDWLGSESVIRRRLLQLVRRNSLSMLTQRNRVEILQDAARFYPRLLEDMDGAPARHPFPHADTRSTTSTSSGVPIRSSTTARMKDVLAAKTRAGVAVRLLYDPLGSHAHISRAYVPGVRGGGRPVSPTSRSTGRTRSAIATAGRSA